MVWFCPIKRNNASKSSGSTIKHGVAMLNRSCLRWLKVLFKRFSKTIQNNSYRSLFFGGYGSPGEGWTDTPNSSWADAFSAAGATNIIYRSMSTIRWRSTFRNVRCKLDWWLAQSKTIKISSSFKTASELSRRFSVVWYFELIQRLLSSDVLSLNNSLSRR